MPITIHEIETNVHVDTRGSNDNEHDNEQNNLPPHNWQDITRREAQREARTSAWNFED